MPLVTRAGGAAPVSSQAIIKSLASCCSMWVQLCPSPGLKPPWRDRSSEASAETLRPALSRLSYCRWPQTPPCNRQGQSLERATTPTWHHNQDTYVFMAAIRRSPVLRKDVALHHSVSQRAATAEVMVPIYGICSLPII